MQNSNFKFQNDNVKFKIFKKEVVILGIQTAESPNSVCLLSADGNIKSQKVIADQRHASEQIANTLKYLLREVKITIKDINAVATCIGPGSYTGLRGGIAFAKAFCQFGNARLIAVTAFEALEFKARIDKDYSNAEVIPMLDAGRDRVFINLRGAYRVVNVEKFLNKIEPKSSKLLFIGSGATTYKEIIKERFGRAEILQEKSRLESLDIALVGLLKFKNKEFSQVYKLNPLYVLPPNITKPRSNG